MDKEQSVLFSLKVTCVAVKSSPKIFMLAEQPRSPISPKASLYRATPFMVPPRLFQIQKHLDTFKKSLRIIVGAMSHDMPGGFSQFAG